VTLKSKFSDFSLYKQLDKNLRNKQLASHLPPAVKEIKQLNQKYYDFKNAK
jgi:hypothetical protein